MSSQEAYHPEGPSGDKADDVEKDAEHDEKEDALVHLVASGRVENREAAERYLDALNQIKVKLLRFARDQVTCESSSQDMKLNRGYSRPAIVSNSGLDKITADGLDRDNPELWKLERTIESSYTDYLEEQALLSENGVGLKDRLEISLADSPGVSIYPDSGTFGRNTFNRLRDYLTEEDFAFIAKEYGFTAKDLARKLRAVADHVTRHTGPADSWERFSPEEGKR